MQVVLAVLVCIGAVSLLGTALLLVTLGFLFDLAAVMVTRG